MKMIEVLGPDDVSVGWIPAEYLELLQELKACWEDRNSNPLDMDEICIKLDGFED